MKMEGKKKSKKTTSNRGREQDEEESIYRNAAKNKTKQITEEIRRSEPEVNDRGKDNM